MMSSKTLWYLRILGTFFRKSVDIAPFLSQNDGESAIFSDSIRSFAFFCKMIDMYLMQWRCRCRTDYGLWIFSGVHFLFSISFWKSHSYLRMALFLFCAISTILKNSFCVFLQFSRFSEKSTDNLLVGFGIYSEGAFLTNSLFIRKSSFPWNSSYCCVLYLHFCCHATICLLGREYPF